jgi:hypothetical protein
MCILRNLFLAFTLFVAVVITRHNGPSVTRSVIDEGHCVTRSVIHDGHCVTHNTEPIHTP